MTGQHIFSIQAPFAAESAADVRRNNANLLLGESKGSGQVSAHPVRRLSGKPYGEVTRRFRLYNDTPGFDRQRHLAWARDMHSANMLGFGKGFVHVAAFFCRD